jgi:hypothetical protein
LREERILLAHTTAVGVWLMASVILLTFWFGGAMLGIAVVWPVHQGSRWSMFVDVERVFSAAAAATALTIASWIVGYRIAGARIDTSE